MLRALRNTGRSGPMKERIYPKEPSVPEFRSVRILDRPEYASLLQSIPDAETLVLLRLS